jgi:hypothetical protein
MARLLFQRDSASWARVERELDNAAGPDALTATIIDVGVSKGAKSQLAYVETMAQIATLRGRSESIPSLGDDIRDGQARRFERYGEQTHVLSEKQAAAIARDMIRWQRVEAH